MHPILIGQAVIFGFGDSYIIACPIIKNRHMSNKYSFKSRKRTPWDNYPNLSKLEEFIRNNYREHYDLRHPDLNEKKLLNSFEVHECKYCGSLNIRKSGKTKNNIQRYYCCDCKKTFTILKNTIFENHKISISEWIEFLLYLFGYESIQEISKSNKNSYSTSKYWIKKLFLLLEHYQDNIVLKGKVYLDETYYKVMQKDVQKRKEGIEYAGLSRNQICIGVARDSKQIFVKVEGLGKTNISKTINTFKDHIAMNSHLIHDKERVHNNLIDLLHLTHEAYDGNDLKNLDDKDNPLNPINKTIMFIKKFLNSHLGFNREELQDYLNLFAFMTNEKGEPLERVKRMVYLALTTPISLKYRDYYKKSDKI